MTMLPALGNRSALGDSNTFHKEYEHEEIFGSSEANRNAERI